MNFKIFFLVFFFFWLIAFNKKFLFWVYLWQLKEYHLGRFLAHFQTEKGKKIILNRLNLFKLSLIVFPFFLPLLFLLFSANFDIFIFYLSAVFLIFVLEGAKTLWNFKRKTLKTPIFTKKTVLIIFTGILFEILIIFTLSVAILQKTYDFPFSLSHLFYFYLLIFYLLILDFLTPIFSTISVFSWHPLAIFWRWHIIKKAKEKRTRFKDLSVIGITGSYGKTSTKEFLTTILSEKYKVLKTKEHQNSEVGISRCILNDLKPEHQVFVCEMGAYNRGGIKLLCDIAKPKIGILTGINEQHMATFGSQENITKTKYELIESLPEDSLAVFNGDNEYCRKLYSKTQNQKTQNQKTQKPKKIIHTTFLTAVRNVVWVDFWVEDITVGREMVVFKVFSKDGDSAEFKINLMGAHNITNILGAVSAAKELGMTLEEISKACRKIKPRQGGMQLKKGIDGLNVIDATYSANPNGVISHLEYLKIWPGKKIIVMPCLIELGSASIGIHQRIGDKIGQVCDLAIITTKERFKEVKEGAVAKGMKTENILFVENPKEILEKIRGFAQPGDVVLLESRVSKELIKLLSD